MTRNRHHEIRLEIPTSILLELNMKTTLMVALKQYHFVDQFAAIVTYWLWV